jgi:hypothetical protein
MSDHIVLKVAMMCSGCSGAVERVLGKMEGTIILQFYDDVCLSSLFRLHPRRSDHLIFQTQPSNACSHPAPRRPVLRREPRDTESHGRGHGDAGAGDGHDRQDGQGGGDLERLIFTQGRVMMRDG